MSAPSRRLDAEELLDAATWAAVLGLLLWSAWQRWAVLTSSPYPIGIDGYYYPIQLRALLERGHLAYPTSPLAFWLMLPLAALTDPVTGAKLGAALGGAAVAVPAFLVGRRLGGRAGGLAAAVAATTTGGSFYLSFEFVKNGFGLTLALVAVWLALRACDPRPDGRPATGRIALAVLAVVATALTHKLATGVALVLIAPLAAVALHRRLGGRALRWLALTAAALVTLTIALGLAMPDRFLGAREVELARQAVGDRADWTLPALVIEHGPRRPPTRITIGGQAPIAAVVTAALVAVVVLVRRRPAWRPAHTAEQRALIWATVALIAVTSLPWLAVHDPDGLGFRLRTSAFAPLAVVAAALVARLAAPLGARRALVVVSPLLLAWLALGPTTSTEGIVRPHPAMVAAIRAARGALPADAVVITAERDLGFALAWYARVPVRMRPGPVPPARRWRMLPGNLIRFGSPLERTLDRARATPGVAPPLRLHPLHPAGLVLVPEATWDWVLAELPPRDAAWGGSGPTI